MTVSRWYRINRRRARTGAIAGALRPYDLAFVAGGGPTTGEFYGYATVKTDKDDYQPGEIVTISGSGWQPGETVTLRVSEDADTHYDWNLTAVADEQGNIVNREFYPRQDEQFQHLGMRFYVMASGAAWQALNTFTDGAVRVRARISGTNNCRDFPCRLAESVHSKHQHNLRWNGDFDVSGGSL